MDLKSQILNQRYEPRDKPRTRFRSLLRGIGPVAVKLFVACLFLNACTRHQPEKIRITEKNIINETGYGHALDWFDEQNKDSIPQTYWFSPGITSFWPAGLVLDLGRKYKITRISLYDGKIGKHNGSHYEINKGVLSVSGGKPFEWNEPVQYELKNAGQWVEIEWNVETRYVQLQKIATEQYFWQGTGPYNCDLAINEIILEGYPLEKEQPEPESEHVPSGITVDQFIGMNSYMWTPDRVHDAVGNVREYHSWSWNGVPDEQTPVSWEPVKNTGSTDDYYKKLHDRKVEAVPCLVGFVEPGKSMVKPCFGKDPSEPGSYSLMADYLFQFAARYGHRTVADSLLRTTEKPPKKSGLGWLNYMENWNEGDRYWGAPEEHFTPWQFAAFCSACYDGDQGKMGPGYGVKSADPDMKLVLGGLASIELGFVQSMKLWADHYRNGSFPADVLNFHHYNNTEGMQHALKQAHGVSPEADHFKERMQKLVNWRNRNLPGKEIWISEFGWDTGEDSFISATGHKNYPDKISLDELQAIWLLRGYLAGTAAGVDRMMMFLANDLDGKGVFTNSGFIRRDGSFKPSWFYTVTLKNTLAGMVFLDEYQSGNENVWIYRYKNPGTGKGAYVLWCPTSDGTTVGNYELKLTGNAASAMKVSLADKQESGVRDRLEVTDHSVKIDVSERPVFVLVDHI
ncbi:MAG: hypothetical protein AB2L20_19920 [Mangrovibacterium sp.]